MGGLSEVEKIMAQRREVLITGVELPCQTAKAN